MGDVPEKPGLAACTKACRTSATMAGLLKRISKPATPVLWMISLCSGLGA